MVNGMASRETSTLGGEAVAVYPEGLTHLLGVHSSIIEGVWGHGQGEMPFSL
jgi:hypothetical protein